MSVATRPTGAAFPRTVQRALLTAVLLGIAGLTLHQPLLAGAALTGLFVGLGVAGLSTTPGRVTVAATVLPFGLVTAVAVIGVLGVGVTLSAGVDVTVSGSASLGVAALVATVLGLALAGTVTGDVSGESLSQAAWTAMAGAGIGTALVGVAYLLTSYEGAATPLEAALFFAGHGATGVAGTVVFSAAALIGGALAVPDAAVTAPDRRDRLTAVRLRFVVTVAVSAVAVVVLAALVSVLTPAPVASAVLDSPLLRGVLVTFAALGLGVAGLSGLVRLTWERVEDGHNPDTAILLGTTVSLMVILGGGLALGVAPGVLFLVPVLLFLAGSGLWGLQGLLDTFGGSVTRREMFPGLLSVLCLAGAAAVAGDVGGTAALDRSSLGTVLTLGAGVFVYAVGRHGAGLTAEVGTAGARRRPQLVHVAYAGTVVFLGTVVALVGFWVAMAIAPTVSVPATVGIVSALLATVLVARFLLR